MEIKKASRSEVKLRIGISAASGFGKTYSALLLAHGITGDWEKIAVIDTENDSASLYSNLGPFKTLRLVWVESNAYVASLLQIADQIQDCIAMWLPWITT